MIAQITAGFDFLRFDEPIYSVELALDHFCFFVHCTRKCPPPRARHWRNQKRSLASLSKLCGSPDWLQFSKSGKEEQMDISSSFD
jgi:hypothetical protein